MFMVYCNRSAIKNLFVDTREYVEWSQTDLDYILRKVIYIL